MKDQAARVAFLLFWFPIHAPRPSHGGALSREIP